MCEKSADENMSAQAEFKRRLFALPIMADAYDQLSRIYCGTKERNRLLKLTMETAESGMGVIVSSAQPVFSRFDKQMVMLDNIACSQLDWLEHSYPIITKPTDEVVKETKQKCTGAVQPMVNCVNSVKDYGYSKVSGLRTYTGGKMEGIRKYGVDTVTAATKVGSDQVTRVLSTQLCREVLNRFDAALDVADHCVDTYLPEGNEEILNKKSADADVFVLSKAYQLSSKVQRRLYTRASQRLEKVQVQAKETIAKLNLVINWIELTKSNVNGAKEKAFHIWQEITKEENKVVEDAAKEDLTYYDSTFDRKLIATARQLLTKLKGIVSWVDEVSGVSAIRNVPGAVQEKLHSSVALVQTLPESLRERVMGLGNMVHSLSDAFSKETINVKDLPQSVLDNARNTLHQLYDSVTDLVDWTLKNTSGYERIGQLFHKNHHDSEKSNLSSFSEDSETENESQKLRDEKDDREKCQKESSEEENSDDASPECDTTSKNPEFEGKDQVTEKKNEASSSSQQGGDEADRQRNRGDDADNQEEDTEVNAENKENFQ